MGGPSRLIMLLTTPFPSLLHRPSSSLLLLRPLARRLSTTTTTNPRRFPLSFPRTIRSSNQQLHSQSPSSINEPSSMNSPHKVSHPWHEWSHLVNILLSQELQLSTAQGHGLPPEDAFVVYEEKELSDEFSRSASACLAFARARPQLLCLLSRKDIEVIVSNGTPFLFKTALDTARRMRAYLGLDGSNVCSMVLDSHNANTVDIMKYILSYASNPSAPTARNNLYSRELVESSVRNLLRQMTEVSLGNPAFDRPASDQYQFLGEYDQTSRPLRQNVQMKRGDWVCPKCSFMNFARNVKCLECEGPRPKRQLTGGEWECPECNFFNYARNLVCLRCDCKRPEEAVANYGNSMSQLGYNDNSAYKSNVNRRIVENEEKAQRWFNKVSQLNDASDPSSLAADEDFPEIMPLRKGENRFVLSTRKTPLERRLANSQNHGQLGNYGPSDGNASQSRTGSKTLDSSIGQRLDQVLGCSSPTSGMDGQGTVAEQSTRMDSSGSLSRPTPSEYGQPLESNSTRIPIAPLPAEMFSRQDQNFKTQVQKNEVEESCDFVSSASNPQSVSVGISGDLANSKQSADFPRKPKSQIDNVKEDEKQAEKSQRWFQRVAELHNVKDLHSAISDEEFPDIMPMRKGENRFVVSKKKDRSLTSPAYKRQVALGQERNSNFVPFVPFPPGYFTRKDTQGSDQIESSTKPLGERSFSSEIVESLPEKQVCAGPMVPQSNVVEKTDNQVRSSGDQNVNNWAPIRENSNQSSSTTHNMRSEIEQNTSESMNLAARSWREPENKDIGSGWTGTKSLEGSAVKEPNPLDMSEEAKAERWFLRVAQIKDISELSQIPDEDFPSIMPMRKGVNRFVVSKRKTPLERRLTSQHRRNLPTASSDLMRKEDNNN